MPRLEEAGTAYVEKTRGLVDGAGETFETELALNVRTEIAYGIFDDWCTALSWRGDGQSFLTQNRDMNCHQEFRCTLSLG